MRDDLITGLEGHGDNKGSVQAGVGSGKLEIGSQSMYDIYRKKDSLETAWARARPVGWVVECRAKALFGGVVVAGLRSKERS